MSDIPTIGDLRRAGDLLECGCWQCGRHGYFDLRRMPLPDELPIAEAHWNLCCSNCGARNQRRGLPWHKGYPIWARGDCRRALMGLPEGGRPKDLAPIVDLPGKPVPS